MGIIIGHADDLIIDYVGPSSLYTSYTQPNILYV